MRDGHRLTVHVTAIARQVDGSRRRFQAAEVAVVELVRVESFEHVRQRFAHNLGGFLLAESRHRVHVLLQLAVQL